MRTDLRKGVAAGNRRTAYVKLTKRAVETARDAGKVLREMIFKKLANRKESEVE